MKTTMLLAFGVLRLSGCGLLGAKSVPKEQLNADIGSTSVNLKDGTEWLFSGDSQRCFAVNDGESKFAASNADVSMTVASWRDITLGSSKLYRTLFGKVMLRYRHDNGKWFLEKVEPTDLISKTLEPEQFKQFLDIQMPRGKYYRHTD